MGSKTITIREDVYEKLRNLKDGRSFSELLEDLVEDREVDLEESFGAWKGEKEELVATVEDGREKFREDFGERLG